MNTIPNLVGTIPFRVHGQKALSKFQQEVNARFIAMGGEMPESLRFQCRIATDARENFARIDLPDGETLTLHPKAAPQFGKNRDGHAFLTVTLKYSGDGRGYRFRWIGQNVPRKMQEVAVKHDQGKYVAATTVPLDLAAADVTPSVIVGGYGNAPSRAPEKVREYDRARRARKAAGVPAKRGPRSCARLTADDLTA